LIVALLGEAVRLAPSASNIHRARDGVYAVVAAGRRDAQSNVSATALIAIGMTMFFGFRWAA
jgi:hypothetical protein